MTDEQIVECNCLSMNWRHECSTDAAWEIYEVGVRAGDKDNLSAEVERLEAEVAKLADVLMDAHVVIVATSIELYESRPLLYPIGLHALAPKLEKLHTHTGLALKPYITKEHDQFVTAQRRNEGVSEP